MRLQVILLVAIASLVATSTVAGPHTTADIQPFVRRLDVPTKTLFRSHKTHEKAEDDEEEEKGITSTALESVAGSLEISIEQLKAWLKGGGKSTDDVFKALALDSAADSILANP
ncbi:hypothetical protein PC117_g12918 [Phytophthora cactorum]|uniref:RxLR effector protein n=1 Tax=Phytophthora cactorum TaxID=29920 RepID=A0A8T1D6J8_9STRA|nr:hypothetical protein PC117_g12918 [Phytophthora cactorum]